MKLKYYLRGLGIGIVVAALLMGFVKAGGKEKLSDDEIIARAAQLGMVESSVLSSDLASEEKLEETIKTDEKETVTKQKDQDAVAEESKSESSDETESVNKDDKQNDKSDALQAEVEEEQKEIQADTAKDDVKEVQGNKKEDSKEVQGNKKEEKEEPIKELPKDEDKEKKYVVKVNGGDGSRAVANRLEEMGAIKDAATFDKFLCQNGYDRKLVTGTHEFDVGATEQEIAENLMKKPN